MEEADSQSNKLRAATPKPVLAVYCRPPRRGQVKTRLAAEIGEESTLEFYRGCLLLLKDELPTLKKAYQIAICPSDRRDLCYVEEMFSFHDLVLPQVRGNLGLRIASTLSELRILGHERVAIIGSDAPSLPLEFLYDTRKLLDEFDAVLGPSDDGGVWGIAARAGLPSLNDISWGTPSVYNELTEACHRADLSVGVAPEWYDVDDAGSLRRSGDDLIRSTSIRRQEFGTWIESLFFRLDTRKP